MIAPRVPRPASSPPPAGGGLSFAVLQAALHPRSTLPPPQRIGLRFPTPVGHGRGLASRPGWADPGERRRFALAASRFLRRASLPLRATCVRSAFARLHPRPGNGGKAAAFLPAHRQPAAARHRSRLSLSASGCAVPTQAGPPRRQTFLPLRWPIR